MDIKYDYLLVLSPPKIIDTKVEGMKKECNEAIGEFGSQYSRAHLTVIFHFNKSAYQIEPVLPHLKNSVSKLPKFNLAINGYDYFENPDKTKYTIYAKIELNDVSIACVDQLRDMVKGKAILLHITIAKDLTAEAFYKLWPLFEKRAWSESFITDKLTVLRRETFNIKSNYIDIANFEFKNNAVNTRYIYKNKGRRVFPRESLSWEQLRLFDNDLNDD